MSATKKEIVDKANLGESVVVMYLLNCEEPDSRGFYVGDLYIKSPNDMGVFVFDCLAKLNENKTGVEPDGVLLLGLYNAIYVHTSDESIYAMVNEDAEEISPNEFPVFDVNVYDVNEAMLKAIDTISMYDFSLMLV